ncbi:1-acyl-sn-glycerol-3-phosphate acyltransferase [Candidatus Saccharibacteria bacterium]|nr:1-acyl-sn-glycerol-3-phosphate acyltransferase [Candidatus Saccharibacteria bacterium]
MSETDATLHDRLRELGLSQTDVQRRVVQINERQEMNERTARLFSPVLKLLGGITILGYDEAFADKNGSAIIASHHRTWLDVPTLGLAFEQGASAAGRTPRYPRFVAKDNLNLSIFGRYFDRRGAIFVHRGHELEGQAAEAEIDEALEDGEDVVIFPTGTRKHGDDFDEKKLKKTICTIAMKGGTPIMPVWVDNTKVMEGRSLVVFRPLVQVERFDTGSVEHDPERPSPSQEELDIVKALNSEARKLRTRIYDEMMAGKAIAKEHKKRRITTP